MVHGLASSGASIAAAHANRVPSVAHRVPANATRDAFAHRGRAVKSVVFNGTFPIDEPMSSRFADAEAAGDSASDYGEYDEDEYDDEDDEADDGDEEPDDGLPVDEYDVYVPKEPTYNV